jgi:hypothetical protein
MKRATSPNNVLGSFLARCRQGRGCIDLIGDSNTLYADAGENHGWFKGMHPALLRIGLPWWGTGLWSINNGQNNNTSYIPGYQYRPRFSTLVGVTRTPEQGGAGTPPYDVNPPDELGNFCRWAGVAALTNWMPNSYGYTQDSASETGTANAGILFDENCSLGMNNALDAYFWYGTFPTAAGTGNFHPGWRQDTPLTTLEMSAVINPMLPNAYGMAFAKVTKQPRNHGDTKIFAGFRVPGQGDINGPFFATYLNVVRPDLLTGFSISAMLTFGGRSAVEMYVAIQNTPDATIDHYFQARLQPVIDAGQTPFMLIIINTGLNDRVVTGLSADAVNASNTGPGFAANLDAIMSRLTARWVASGRSVNNLYFGLQVSHPQSDNANQAATTWQETLLVTFRRAAEDLARSRTNTFAVDWTALTTSAEMRNNRWYAFDNGRPHMSEAGYEALATRLFADALSTNEPAAVPPFTPVNNMLRSGWSVIVKNDVSNETLAAAGFIPIETVERWIHDFRSGQPSGCVEMAEFDELEFAFVSPRADNATGSYLVTLLTPVYEDRLNTNGNQSRVPTGYIERRHEAGALTVGALTCGAQAAAANTRLNAGDRVVDTITATLNRAGTEVESPAGDGIATLRVRTLGAPVVRIQTLIAETGSGALGFTVLARRVKGEARPSL